MIKKFLLVIALFLLAILLYFQNPYSRFIISNVLISSQEFVEVADLKIKNGKYYAKVSNGYTEREVSVKLTSPIMDGKTTIDYELQNKEFYVKNK